MILGLILGLLLSLILGLPLSLILGFLLGLLLSLLLDDFMRHDGQPYGLFSVRQEDAVLRDGDDGLVVDLLADSITFRLSPLV